ncbi:hypothetical protein M9Y10_039954 [Tritrichomonas musculus]|uniref:Uncharacterized protein n=1 Tax=Tritrichomonas musculus TaxID=1915356 RepID=A0ABR2GQI5_9EUKA
MIQNLCLNFSPFLIIICVLTLFIQSHRSSYNDAFYQKNQRTSNALKNDSINKVFKNQVFNPNSKYAFATLTTPAFCMGAIALGHTLTKYHGSKYDLICLVTPDINETWIKILSQWWRVVKVPNYKPFKGFRRSWAKVFLWDLTEYEKVVYFDTDMIVVGPLDELFTYNQLSCVPDTASPQICNSGVLVIQPKDGTTENMQKTAKKTKLLFGIGDQGFINSYFGRFTPLPSRYNVPRTQGSSFGWAYDNNITRVIHYVCKKPWKCGREGVGYCGCGYPSFNVLWWSVFDEACRNHECIESWAE